MAEVLGEHEEEIRAQDSSEVEEAADAYMQALIDFQNGNRFTMPDWSEFVADDEDD